MTQIGATYVLKTGQNLLAWVNENQNISADSMTGKTAHKIILVNGHVAFVQGDNIAYIEVNTK